MKRILAIMFAILLVLSFCGCQRRTDLEKFLQKNDDTMIGELSALFGESAEISSRVENNAFVFEVKAPEFDYLIDSQKSIVEERLKAVIPTEEVINESRKNNKKLQDLENYTIIVKDSKGEVILTVSSIEKTYTTETVTTVPATVVPTTTK